MKIAHISDIHCNNGNDFNPDMFQKSVRLLNKYETDFVFISGDLTTWGLLTEYEMAAEVLKQINGKLIVVPGNHDGSIMHFIPDDIILHSSGGYIMDGIGFVHGHRWPKKSVMDADFLFCGHSHPTVMLSDRLKYQNFEPCWVKTSLLIEETKKRYDQFNPNVTVLVFPAFNLLCGGSAVNKDGLVGPLKNILDLENAELFLLDGTDIGKVKRI